MRLDIVDLGTKHGNAISEFLGKGRQYLTKPESLLPKNCVGYERPEGEEYRLIMEKKGFQFRVADLANDLEISLLPPAEVYLAWHFLEHVPNHDWARKLVIASLRNSKQVAWFRLPSFQQDEVTGEGVLRNHGMRFTWTNWTGHPTPWTVQDCIASITEWTSQHPGRSFELIVKPADRVRDMSDERVVPIGTPTNVNKYEPKYGPKPLSIKFSRPIIAAWEVIVRFK